MAEAVAAQSNFGAQARLNQTRAVARRPGVAGGIGSPLPQPPTAPARTTSQPENNTQPQSVGAQFRAAQAATRQATKAKSAKSGKTSQAKAALNKAKQATAALKTAANNPVVARRLNTFVWSVLGAPTWFIVPWIVFNLELFWGYYGSKRKSKLVPALTWENIEGAKYLKFLPNLFLHAALLVFDILLFIALVMSLFVQIIVYFMPVIIAGGIVAVLTGTVNVPPALLKFFSSFLGL